MGLVTMDEDTTRQNGALGLDVTAKVFALKAQMDSGICLIMRTRVVSIL